MVNGIVNHCAALQFLPPDYFGGRTTVDDDAYLKRGLNINRLKHLTNPQHYTRISFHFLHGHCNTQCGTSYVKFSKQIGHGDKIGKRLK